jgi:hypothetical protein
MLLLFGSACGDRVIVARGASLVSAAQSTDAGVGDAQADEGSHVGTGSGDSSDRHTSNRSTPDPHDKDDKDSSSTNDSKHH